jgi:hypothetical protein
LWNAERLARVDDVRVALGPQQPFEQRRRIRMLRRCQRSTHLADVLADRRALPSGLHAGGQRAASRGFLLGTSLRRLPPTFVLFPCTTLCRDAFVVRTYRLGRFHKADDDVVQARLESLPLAVRPRAARAQVHGRDRECEATGWRVCVFLAVVRWRIRRLRQFGSLDLLGDGDTNTVFTDDRDGCGLAVVGTELDAMTASEQRFEQHIENAKCAVDSAEGDGEIEHAYCRSRPKHMLRIWLGRPHRGHGRSHQPMRRLKHIRHGEQVLRTRLERTLLCDRARRWFWW